MMFNTEKYSMTIKKVDGGYVVEWSKPKPKRNPQMSAFPSMEEPENSGTKIFTKKKEMIEFVERHFPK